MLGTIKEIIHNQVLIALDIDLSQQTNLMNIHVVFEDQATKIVGEIVEGTKDTLKVNIVGQIVENTFLPGSRQKPSFRSQVRIVTMEELALILGSQQITSQTMMLGYSTTYSNYPINMDMNAFFSNHFAILGNSGSGKSFAVSRILQNIFTDPTKTPLGANIFLFDAYGEYTAALKELPQLNPNMRYKSYTTNTNFGDSEVLQIPLWLLDVDDIALLLEVTTPNQLPIIEKALRLVPVLTGDDEQVIPAKNDIIARALLDILLSGHQSTKIRDQVIAVLTKFNTKELNLESLIVQPGYTRTLKQCLYIDKMGKLQEMELVVNFVKTFIKEQLEETTTAPRLIPYSLKDLETAMDFALISEGILKSDKVYDYANILSVRLHSLVNSKYHVFFDVDQYISKEGYIKKLLTSYDQKKCQIVNFNISYIEDRLAKTITKILSRLLFTSSLASTNRGKNTYHIVIEEAHRYVQKDTDTDILGYNIFDRITKEGRKYGVILGLITQRPSELSDTALSQCSNFIILRTLHPNDLQYIKDMVPSISLEVAESLKNLTPGNAIAFGSAFKVPINLYFARPTPEPLSNNVDVCQIWYDS